MPLWPAFVGPAYQARSQNLDDEALINLYVESVQSTGNAKKTTLLGTPGLRPIGTALADGCRGSLRVNDRCFTVFGAILYEVIPVGIGVSLGVTLTWRGSLTLDDKPVSMTTNGEGGDQLVVCSAGQIGVLTLSTNAWTAPVALPFSHPVLVDFIDGYVLANERDSLNIWFSALEDATSWDALDFFARSTTADNVVGFKVFRRQIWRIGVLTADVVYDSGDADNPFQPYPGSVMHTGTPSAYTLAIMGAAPNDYLVWLAQSATGNASIVRAADYSPSDIGTPALAFALGTYVTLDDAEAFAYEQEEHGFYVITFPSDGAQGTTWAFDALETARLGQPIWHQRDSWDADRGQFTAWRARGYVAAFGACLIGDRDTTDFYELDLDTFDENGNILRSVRRMPYVGAENQTIFLDQFELGAQTGVGLPSGQGSDPVALLRISWDSGHTWFGPIEATLGDIGEYEAATRWYQLGGGRQDRMVIEVYVTDPVRRAFGPGAWLRITPGSGQM